MTRVDFKVAAVIPIIPGDWKMYRDSCTNAFFVRLLSRTTRDVYQVLEPGELKHEKRPVILEFSDESGQFDSLDSFAKWFGKTDGPMISTRRCGREYVDAAALQVFYKAEDNEFWNPESEKEEGPWTEFDFEAQIEKEVTE